MDMFLLKSLSFKGLEQKVIKLDTEHIEPIVVEDGLEMVSLIQKL